MTKLIVIAVIVTLVATFGTFAMINHAYGHEGDGKDKNAYRHLVAPLKIGPHIMSTRWCPGSAEVQIISVDTNRDGYADECYLLRLEHHILHFKPTFIRIDTETGFCLPICCEEDQWDY